MSVSPTDPSDLVTNNVMTTYTYQQRAKEKWAKKKRRRKEERAQEIQREQKKMQQKKMQQKMEQQAQAAWTLIDQLDDHPDLTWELSNNEDMLLVSHKSAPDVNISLTKKEIYEEVFSINEIEQMVHVKMNQPHSPDKIKVKGLDHIIQNSEHPEAGTWADYEKTIKNIIKTGKGREKKEESSETEEFMSEEEYDESISKIDEAING